MKKATTNNLTCLYYGPIARKGQGARGGFEAANRKNISALETSGVRVIEMPDPIKPSGPLGALVYLKMLFTPYRMVPFIGRRNVVAHFTPIYGSILYVSALAPIFARIIGMKTVVDIRAGSFMNIYKRSNAIYKWLVRRVLRSASVVTVEGHRYVDELQPLAKKTPVYFPNLCAKEVDVSTERLVHSPLRIFYFGRITANKGISVIVDAWRALGDGCELYMAGPVAPDVDIEKLKAEGVKYLGILKPDELNDKLSEMDFFLFPTTHSGEGQSNALIEAMAAGLVPIASDNGFNADVVGDTGVILPKDAGGEAYATAVRKLAHEFSARSLAARRHIAVNHNLNKEIDKLINIYQSL